MEASKVPEANLWLGFGFIYNFSGFQTDLSMTGVGYKNTEPSYFCRVGKVYISPSLIRG